MALLYAEVAKHSSPADCWSAPPLSDLLPPTATPLSIRPTARQLSVGCRLLACRCIVDGKVYDLTEFADEHPGGEELIHSAPAAHPPSLLLGSAWGVCWRPLRCGRVRPPPTFPACCWGLSGGCAGAC